mgnify:CR=1 FL=1
MFGWADSRFGKPRISFWEGFNFVSANLSFMCAASRFAKPRTSRKGNGLVLFAACKKYRKNTLGRAKSCRWQVFVRRRPPKQGELRTDVSKATMFQGDRGLRPSGVLPVLFVQAKRIKPFPFRELSRFSKPRFSSPQWRLRTNPIKSFAAPRPFRRPAATFFLLFVKHKK